MSYDMVMSLIKDKKPDMDNETLKFFSNYFFVVVKKGVIPPEITLESLIDNALTYASKIVFYDESHPYYKKLGSDVKGCRSKEYKAIFIRDNLEEPLKEIIVYHELHHAVQTNAETDKVGINQKSNIGRMIMEAQTQYFAEEVYKEIHGVTFEEKEIPTENLRMNSGGTVISSLHNYEMYDNLLTKLSIILEVPKDYFVYINYLGKNNLGLKLLEEKYISYKNKYQLPYAFYELLLYYDYIYCVDLLTYVDNPFKSKIINGGTINGYNVHPNKKMPLSLDYQYSTLSHLDYVYFASLARNSKHYKDFAKYIIDNQKRDLTMQFISIEEEQSLGLKILKKLKLKKYLKKLK